MQANRYVFRITVLVLLASLTPAAAEEPAEPDLATAIAESPLELWEAVTRGGARNGATLRAGFALDTNGRLVLRMLVRTVKDEAERFEEWRGPLYDQVWAPRRRVLADGEEIANARRLDDLVRKSKRTLSTAVTSSRGVQREDESWPGVPVSIEPTLRDGEVRTEAIVIIDSRYYRVTQILDSGIILSTKPAEEPVRIEADPPRTLPELTVPDGIWVNAGEPPTLASWKGSPILVAVADPG